MADTSRSLRRSKRIMNAMGEDESTNGQPSEKTVKKEAEAPNVAEVEELKKKVATIEATAAAAEKKAEESAARTAELELELKKEREERREEMEKGKEKEKTCEILTCEQVLELLNKSVQLKRDAFESVRRLLGEKKISIDEVIKCGLIPEIVKGLSIDDVKIQHACASILKEISSSYRYQHLREVVKEGAIPPLIKLMMHANFELAEIATSAIAKIANGDTGERALIIQSNGVEALMHLIGKLNELSTSFQVSLARIFEYMCRCMPLPVLVQGLLRLMQSEEFDVRRIACWAVSHLARGPDAQKSFVRDSGIMPHIYKLLVLDTIGMVAPALCVLINMANGNESHKQSVINLGALRVLPEVARKLKSSYIENNCIELITNVLEGTEQQRQAVIDNELLSMIVTVMKTGYIFGGQHVSLMAVVQLTKGNTESQILSLLAEKPFPSLASILSHTYAKVLHHVLEVIYVLLTTVSKARPDEMDAVKKEMEESGVIGHLETMKMDNYTRKYAEMIAVKERTLARKILSEFFA